MANIKLGCDVSKADIHVCLYDTEKDKILGSRKFQNSDHGFEEMEVWCDKKTKGERYDVIMESTGIYHENLVSYFYDKNFICYVVVPRLIKNFAKGQNIRLKNDKSDARVIAVFGAHIGKGPNHVDVIAWTPFTKCYKEMKSYSRQILAMTQDRSKLKNRLHALEFVKDTPEIVKSQITQLIECYDDIINDYTDRMLKLAKADSELYRKLENVATIKGISIISVLHIVSETNGFKLFRNPRQLTAFAGLDIPENQSGRCRKPGHLSKCGNSRIRQVLYMPAMICGNHGSPQMNEFYKRLKQKFGKKHANQAILAVARKLLCLIFTLWKNDCVFDPNHKWQATPKSKIASGNQETGFLLSPQTA